MQDNVAIGRILGFALGILTVVLIYLLARIVFVSFIAQVQFSMVLALALLLIALSLRRFKDVMFGITVGSLFVIVFSAMALFSSAEHEAIISITIALICFITLTIALYYFEQQLPTSDPEEHEAPSPVFENDTTSAPSEVSENQTLPDYQDTPKD